MDVDAVGFLACGWSLASEDTHATAIALDAGEEVVLVDAGGDVPRGLVRTFGTQRLRHVYLTHEHPDHTYALPGLVHHLRFAGERGPLTVHGPSPALERAREAIDALGVTCPFELRWSSIDAASGEDARARWMPTEHSVPTLAYRFGDVVVCGDTAPSGQVVALAEDASLLVHEATHTDPERTHGAGHSTPSDAAQAASQAGVDALALIHVHPSLGRDGAREASAFEPTFAPADGDLIHRDGAGTWTLKGDP